ncbi:MAG: hypothetical protein ACD_37C00209G0003 [uncultured bacterium]|nr:MAG: hypothetical protein ACD_37C00209G0003 [uncultured bacterium]
MTPSLRGLIATIFPGVLPNISLASFPTATTLFSSAVTATTVGSFITMPSPTR